MDFYKSKSFWLTFAIGFFLGLIIFLPLSAFKTKLISSISKATGMNIQISEISLGTGLTYKGRNLLALKGKHAVLPLGKKGELQCQELAVSPSLLGLLLLKIQTTIFCRLSDTSSVTIQAQSGTLFDLKKLAVDLYPKNFVLDVLQLNGLEGEINGEAHITDFNPQSNQLSKLDLKLSAEKLKTPSLNSVFFNLPEIDLNKVEARAFLDDKELSIKKLVFGTSSSPLQGKLGGNIALNARKMPVGGKISGELRTDPTFEKSHLKDIGMDSAFGPINQDTGRRKFTKAVKSGFQWILAPPIDNNS